MISQYSGVVSSRDLQRRFANIDQSGACFDFDADSEIGHVVKAIKADPRPERVRRDFTEDKHATIEVTGIIMIGYLEKLMPGL